MKRITLFLILSLVLIGQAQAQRYLSGQKGIQVTGGFVDGFTLEKKRQAGVLWRSCVINLYQEWQPMGIRYGVYAEIT